MSRNASSSTSGAEPASVRNKSSKKPAPLKWKNPRGIGKVYVRRYNGDGWLWTSVGGKQETTKIRWPEQAENPDELKTLQKEAIADAMVILKQRVLYYEHPELIPKPKPVADPESAVVIPSLVEAWAEFGRVRMPNINPRAHRLRFRNASKTFLLHLEAGFGDIPLTETALQDRITAMRDVCGLSDYSMKRGLQLVRQIVQYFVDKKWIETNVVDVIGMPKGGSKGEVLVYSQDELARMEQWGREHPRFANFALYAAFMWRTGLRLNEAGALRWEHFSKNRFLIHGKRTTANPSGKREFPFLDSEGQEVVPGLLAVIEALRERNPTGPVLGYEQSRRPQREMAHCQKALGISDGGRAIHTLRKTALNFWLTELDWDVETAADMLGDSIDVVLQYYRQLIKADVLARKITHHRRRSLASGRELRFDEK